ncbi:MAG TPA: DNA translocase FtsK 4TM domain-containing protein, partial [Rhodocyclaceae bacterium]
MNASLGAAPANQPLPEKIVALMNEARWLLFAAGVCYLSLILWGFSLADPGWSHAALTERVANPGGRFGAWLADLLYYFLGFSAWWCVVFLVFQVIWGFHRLEGVLSKDRRPFLIAVLGFCVVLVASAGVEALRFWSLKAATPLAPGGLLGAEVGALTVRYLGFHGGTLVLMAVWAAGMSVFTGLSWLRFVEGFGALLENSWNGIFHLWHTWQDRRYGRVVAEKREAVVEVERKK